MAITATERTQIIELVTLMFNAAPGATYLSQIVSLYEANGHNLQTLAEQLGTTSVFQSLNPNFQTAEEFASSFLTPLGLQNDATAHDFVVSRFNAGVSKADIMYQGFAALTSLGSGASWQYTNALAILQNKEAVAEYYTVTANGNATDLSTLQNVLANVTADPTTVTTAENVINGTAGGGQTFALTTNIDNLTGTSGNDTFIASVDTTTSPSVVTLNALDTVNGGGGVNTLVVNTAGYGQDINIGAGLVTNVQNLTINSTDNQYEYSVYLNDNGFTNIKMVNPYDAAVYGIQEGASVTQQGTAVAGANEGEVYSEYNFDPTTATTVVMNDTVTGAGTNYYNEAYFYHGGSSADGNLANATTIVANLTGSNANIVSSDGEVDAYQYIYADNAGNAGANITVNLSASNNVSQDGSTYNEVESFVYQTGDAHVTANISVVNSADTWVQVDAQDSGVGTAKAANNTANVTLNNVSGTSGDTGVAAYGFDTVNIAVTGAAQLDDGLFFQESNSTTADTNSQTVTINAGANLKTAETYIDTKGSTATIVSGSGNVDLGAYYASGSSTLSGTAGSVVSATIDASALTGNLNVDVKYAINSVKGGSGNDTVYLENVTTAGSTALGGLTLDGGAGTDTLGLNVADWNATISTLSAANLAKITNFEVLALHGALTTATYDPSLISGITSFSAMDGVATTNTASVINLGANATVTLAGDLATNNGVLSVAMKTDTTADTLNLVLKPNGFTDNNDTTADNHVIAETITAANIETLNVTSTAGKITAPTTPVTGYKADYITNALTLTDNQLKSLVISGDTSLSFTAAASQTALTSVDASANTAKHGVSIDMHLDTKAVTMLGSTGNDTLIGTAKADTINGGAGNDSITGGAGGDTLTGGAGNDQFVYNAPTESTLLNLDTITDFSANTWGQGLDSTTSLPNGSATSAGADPTSSKINGDLINIHAIDQTFDTVDGAHTAIKVSVQSNAADAQTFLQNMAADATLATTTGAALDSSSGRLYLDFNHDGTVDTVIQLTGVTTLTSSAFVV